MTKEKPQKMTIDKLAVIMARSFAHLESKMDERFEEVDRRFDAINARFERVDERFDKVEYRLDVIEGKIINNHENRLTRVEDDLRIIKTKLEK